MNSRAKKKPVRKPDKRADPAEAVCAIAYSDNRKTGPVAVTYVPQCTCPRSCPFLGSGCYAEAGHAGIVTRRLAAAAKGLTVNDIAAAEAEAIRRLPALTDLRLHVVGDCPTDESARTVSAACDEYAVRGQGSVAVWTYTHAWRTVPRDAWGTVSVLASCESYSDVEDALARGYACALTVAEWDSDPDAPKPWHVEADDGRRLAVVPCPYQTKGTQCIDCRLCMDDGGLRDRGHVIAFRAHGAGRPSVVRALTVIESSNH